MTATPSVVLVAAILVACGARADGSLRWVTRVPPDDRVECVGGPAYTCSLARPEVTLRNDRGEVAVMGASVLNSQVEISTEVTCGGTTFSRGSRPFVGRFQQRDDGVPLRLDDGSVIVLFPETSTYVAEWCLEETGRWQASDGAGSYRLLWDSLQFELLLEPSSADS